MRFNRAILLGVALGSFLIMSAVVLENSLKQLKITKKWFKKLTTLMFVGGWIIVALVINKGFEMSLLHAFIAILAQASIVTSVVTIVMARERDIKPPIFAKITFVAGWLLFASTLAAANLHLKGINKIVPFVAAGSVLASMIVLLPWQREKCVVDGPGAYLFALGWILIAGSAAYESW